jgi:hypothetical protein
MRQRMSAWAEEHEDEVAEALTTGVLAGVWPEHTPVKDPQQAILDSEGDAEQKAADSLSRRGFDVKPLEVSLIAHALWGHGLTDEREDRLTKLVDDGTSPRSVQAARGHVTRGLLSEITDLLRQENRT